MSNFQDKVLEFQLASGQPVHLQRDLTKEELDFRDNLLREEIRELRDAIVDNDRVEILDALCDIKYVNDGTANMIGFKQNDVDFTIKLEDYGYHSKADAIKAGLSDLEYNNINRRQISRVNSAVTILAYCFGFTLENFKTALNRVHESNMSKFCYDIKTADRTKEFYAKQGINTYVEPKEKKFVVYREGDGKVLKSCDFYPPYLKDLVDSELGTGNYGSSGK